MTKNQYIRLILNNGSELIAKKDQFEVPAITSLRADVAHRVHTQGQDDKGNTRNYKSKAYVKRFKKTNPVTMIKDGDLRRDYNMYENGGDNVLGFRDDLSVLKILGEEGRRKGKLFSVNDEEVQQYKNNVVRFVNRLQKNILNV